MKNQSRGGTRYLSAYFTLIPLEGLGLFHAILIAST